MKFLVSLKPVKDIYLDTKGSMMIFAIQRLIHFAYNLCLSSHRRIMRNWLYCHRYRDSEKSIYITLFLKRMAIPRMIVVIMLHIACDCITTQMPLQHFADKTWPNLVNIIAYMLHVACGCRSAILFHPSSKININFDNCETVIVM